MKNDVVRPRSTPAALRTELERSRVDAVAGRLTPLRGLLTEIHGRATERMNQRRRAAVETLAETR